MSELTTGGINFGYQSPISQIYKDVEYKIKEDMENKTMEAVHYFGMSVDKEELIKALQYDRNQYDKGYSDGRASIVEELEEIKAEMNDYTVATGVLSKAKYSIAQCAFEAMKSIAFTIIDNHINNLK